MDRYEKILKNLKEFERFIWKYAFKRKRWLNKVRIFVWLLRKSEVAIRNIPPIVYYVFRIKVSRNFVDYTCKKIDEAIEKYYEGEFFRKFFGNLLGRYSDKSPRKEEN